MREDFNAFGWDVTFREILQLINSFPHRSPLALNRPWIDDVAKVSDLHRVTSPASDKNLDLEQVLDLSGSLVAHFGVKAHDVDGYRYEPSIGVEDASGSNNRERR